MSYCAKSDATVHELGKKKKKAPATTKQPLPSSSKVTGLNHFLIWPGILNVSSNHAGVLTNSIKNKWGSYLRSVHFLQTFPLHIVLASPENTPQVGNMCAHNGPMTMETSLTAWLCYFFVSAWQMDIKDWHTAPPPSFITLDNNWRDMIITTSSLTSSHI